MEKYVPLALLLSITLGLLAGNFIDSISATGQAIDSPSISDDSSVHEPRYGSDWLYQKNESSPLFVTFTRNMSGWVDRWGVPPFKVRINEEGTRGDRFKTKKPSNTTRILIVGDSVTFGWGVNGSETYPSILEQKLESELPERDIEVINAGVPGTGVKDFYLYLKHKGLKYQPDIVVTSFTNVNWRSNKESYSQHKRAEEKVKREYNLSEKSDAEAQKIVKKEIRRITKEEYSSEIENTSFSYLDNINSLLDSRNISYTFYHISTFPNQDIESYTSSWEEKHNKTIHRSPKELRERRQEIVISDFDKHPNAEGHQIIAEGLYKPLKDQVKEELQNAG